MNLVYLDNNATTQTAPQVVEAVITALREDWGNPSSIHASGRRARQGLDEAREEIAHLIGAKPREIVFTGGGTEAEFLAFEVGAFGDRQAVESGGRRAFRQDGDDDFDQQK